MGINNNKKTDPQAKSQGVESAFDKEYIKVLQIAGLVLICALIVIMGVGFTIKATDANQLKTLYLFLIVPVLSILFFLRYALIRRIVIVRAGRMGILSGKSRSPGRAPEPLSTSSKSPGKTANATRQSPSSYQHYLRKAC